MGEAAKERELENACVQSNPMNKLLTRGLRHKHLHGREDWRELVTRAIQGKWPVPVASPQTTQAERGLGIPGEPYYFYVLRAEDSYGLVVFVLSEAEAAAWPANAMGATPFDSGGWWLGKIHTDPALDASARQAAFQTLDVPLPDWQRAFERYVLAYYGTVGDYIKGLSPGSDSTPAGTGFTFIKAQPNTARAWTWEVRVPHGLIAGRLALQAVYMTEVSRDEYVDWLWRSALTDNESYRIHRWVEDHVVVPKHDELVVQAVNESIALEVAHG